jgi:hypothetical protein
MRSNRAFALALAGTVVIGQTALTAEPAQALTPVSELRDVSPDHWAYNAIQTLVEKYQVMEGFPDKSFRGSKTLTRYEMAAALAKVMARVEERIAIATGQPINVDPGVNPEDLRTIARLQREFREELDQLKSRVDTIDSRVMALEKRVKISGYNRMDYRDWVGGNAALTNSPSADFRVRNALDMDAQLTDELTFNGTLNADLYPPQSVGNSFLRGTSGAPMMDVYLPRAEINYNPGWVTYGVGVGALRNHLPLGSTFTDPFKMNAWTNGTGGYGFVGTPGVNLAGAGSAVAMQGTAGFAGAPLWLPGTNVIVDMVDPNNSSLYAPHGDLLSAGHLMLGPVRLGLGFNRGALAGPQVFAGAMGGTPGVPFSVSAASLPQMMSWNGGSRVTGTAGLDLGLLRLNAVATGPSNTLTNTAQNDKWIGGSVDLGNEGLGLSYEILGTSSLAFAGYQPNRTSLRLGAMNILDTGFGLNFGWVAGNVATMTGAAGGPMSFAAPRNSLFSSPDFNSIGAMLKTPSLFIIPSFTLAAQQSGGPGSMFSATSAAIGSGFTIQTEYQLFGLPALTIEYSRGKFGAGADQSLFGASPFTHDQVGLATTVRF